MIFFSRPRSEIKIQNKNVSTEGDNKSSYYVYILCFIHWTCMIQFGWRKQRKHTVYYKESTPFCRKTIINQCRVKQITENNVELNLIRNYLYLVFGSIKIFSDLKGSSSKQLLIPNHVIILIVFATRDNSQCWLLFCSRP